MDTREAMDINEALQRILLSDEDISNFWREMQNIQKEREERIK